MEERPTIPRPIFMKDLILAQLENRIRQDVEQLLEVADPARLTHFWQQQTAWLRSQGGLLPGDGRGGFIEHKGKTSHGPLQEGD